MNIADEFRYVRRKRSLYLWLRMPRYVLHHLREFVRVVSRETWGFVD